MLCLNMYDLPLRSVSTVLSFSLPSIFLSCFLSFKLQRSPLSFFIVSSPVMC